MKINKLDYTTIRSYCIIGLLNCLSNVCETVVADKLSEWCKVNHVFHEGQIGVR